MCSDGQANSICIKTQLNTQYLKVAKTAKCIISLCRHHLPIALYFWLNILRPRQDGRHIADDIFKCIFLFENAWISITISLKFVPKGPINNIPALVQIMAWRRPGDKPFSEPMMVSLLTHICVTRPQWVNIIDAEHKISNFEDNLIKRIS